MKTKPLLLSSLFALSAASSAFAQSVTPSMVPNPPTGKDDRREGIAVLAQPNVIGAGVAAAGFDGDHDYWAVRGDFAHSLPALWEKDSSLSKVFSFAGEQTYRGEFSVILEQAGALVWNLGADFKSIGRDENVVGVNFSFPDKEIIPYGGLGLRAAFGGTGIMVTAGLQASSVNFGFEDGFTWIRKPHRISDSYSLGRPYYRLGVEGAIGLGRFSSIEFKADTNMNDNRVNLVVPVGKKFSLTGGWDRRFGTGIGGRFVF